MDASPAPLRRSKWVRFALAQLFLSIGEYFYREQRSMESATICKRAPPFARRAVLFLRINREIQVAALQAPFSREFPMLTSRSRSGINRKIQGAIAGRPAASAESATICKHPPPSHASLIGEITGKYRPPRIALRHYP
jgi:hypothetical protein